MILYHLQCESGHQFEAWFRDRCTYNSQSGSGYVECPFCGDYHVSEAALSEAQVTASAEDGGPGFSNRAHSVADQILNAVEKLRGQVADPMGEDEDDCPLESHRIDYGEADGDGPVDWPEDGPEDCPEDSDEDAGGNFRLPSVSRQKD